MVSALMFIMYHAGLAFCVGTFSRNILADDLGALVVPLIDRYIDRMIEFI